MISKEKKKLLDSHSRVYVVGRGKRTSHEHLCGYRATDGKHMGYSTSGRANAVAIPRNMSTYAKDKRGKLVIHHNHPAGTSLSREDLFNLGEFPGTLEVHAHGHAKQWYVAEAKRERNFEELILVAEGTFRNFLKQVWVPQGVQNHVFNLAFSRAGAIRYEYVLDEPARQAYTNLLVKGLDNLFRNVRAAVDEERGRR